MQLIDIHNSVVSYRQIIKNIFSYMCIINSYAKQKRLAGCKKVRGQSEAVDRCDEKL